MSLARGFGLGLPGWVPGLTVAILIAGLPIVLATAFVQEGVGGPEAPAKVPTPSVIGKTGWVLDLVNVK